MRKVFVKHHFYVDEDFKEKDFELSEVTDVTWGTYPDDKPNEDDWFLYVDVESYKQLQEENKLLRDVLQKYTHEEVRGVYVKEFLIKGHNYDNSCFACTEYNKGELARKTLAKIKGDESEA